MKRIASFSYASVNRRFNLAAGKHRLFLKASHHAYQLLVLLSIIVLAGCQSGSEPVDAYGNFEATVTTVSAEASGQLRFLRLEEGQTLEEGTLVGLVDTTQLYLQKQQTLARVSSLSQKLQDPNPDIQVLEDQKRNLIRERNRVQNLLASQAATPKQLDDLKGEIVVVNQRIQAARSQTQTANRGVLSEQDPIMAQVRLIEEQIRESYVYNPVRGTVLTQLAEPAEVVTVGSPLYRVGQLDTLTLRAYAESTQLQNVSIGQRVDVLIDEGEESYRTVPGTVRWIASQAEFTPKTIQTKEDRVNLVYALKIAVPNPEGTLKIGMPAEVRFTPAQIANNTTND